MSNRKSPVRFAVDFTNRQIIGTEASLNKAKRYGSNEYNELCQLMEAHPRFTVVRKEIGQNKSKKTYKNLSFKFIEKYISIQPNSDEIKREYQNVKVTAASLEVSVYPYTKSWFLKRFGSKDKPFDMEKALEEINNAKSAAAQVESVM